MSNIMNTYGRLPVSFTKGEGAWLWDENGNKYLDALSGIAVCGLGHAHPTVAKAISEQASTLIHTSNLYGIPLQEELATKLCSLSDMDKVFFSNSGAEANEAAIKIARLYGHQKQIELPTILVAHKSFHGRTLTTLSATGNPKVQEGFSPLVPGFIHVNYNHIDELSEQLKSNSNIVAIMLEPVQGEGGINIPDNNFLTEIRELCNQFDLLMILDEIQTGICRTGKWFAHQHESISPDIMTLAKGLGNGVPIGACLAKGKAAEIFTPGTHGSTYGGNPLVCSAALATIDVLEHKNLAQRAAQLGHFFLTEFTNKLQNQSLVKNIRVKGLMIGIELNKPCTELVKRALEQKLLINVTANQVIRLLPPLIISDDEAQQIVDIICQLIQNFEPS
ncbi:MAG: acetylornithine transaminase [Gammaproteobacteria bacterium]|nr:acetylornithine transaminase [Gammaproteobacteria bacterium]